MTIDIKLTRAFKNPGNLPGLPHGTGVEVDASSYRWIADDIRSADGTVINAWAEHGGGGSLTGSSSAVKMATVNGYRALAFDGSGALSIPAGSPLASSQGTIAGVARLGSAAGAATAYGLTAFSHVTASPNSADGKIQRLTNGKMRFDRLGTAADVFADSVASIAPGQAFTFGFAQRDAGGLAMLNGTSFAVPAGDLQAFQRFFIGTIGSSVNWLGEVFEIDTWGTWLQATHFDAFHAAMKKHYEFLA